MRLLRLAALSLAAVAGWPVVAEAAELDRSFGEAGVRTFATDGYGAAAVAPGRGGRIWVLENGAMAARVFALDRHGDLDAGFGERGVVGIEDANFTYELITLTSGGVMVIGTRGPLALDPFFEPSAWLISPTGAIVSRMDIPLDGFAPSTMAAARAPDSRIVLAITGAREPPRRRATVLVRLTETNELDRGFGRGGIAPAPSAPEVGFGGVAVRTNGKVVLAGPCAYCSGPSVRISQFDRRGAIDKSFGRDGRIRLSSARLNRLGIGAVRGLALAPDGDLLIGLARGSVVRVDGERTDRSFGASGVTRTAFRVGSGGRPLLLRSGGLLNAGTLRRSGRGALIAHTRRGAVNRRLLGPHGRFVLPAPKGFKVVRGESMALDASGRVLIAGRALRDRSSLCCGRLTMWRLHLR
jgi:hypothetical protein